MTDWYVYMLVCDQKTFYVGITNNILKRMNNHLDKGSFFTKKFSDLKITYAEKYPDKYSAAKREKQLKRWGQAKKQLLIQEKLGYNTCTEFVEDLVASDKTLVSLLRA